MIGHFLAALIGLAATAVLAEPPSAVAIEHVDVVTMQDDHVARDQTVIVSGGRILAVTPSGQAHFPTDIQRVDGHGKYLIPGLTDMHVHVTNTETAPASAAEDELFLYLANGVTTVRNMSGSAWHLMIRDELDRGVLLGPRMFTSGPILEQHQSHGAIKPPMFYLLKSPEDAAAEVRRLKAEGYDFIKVYNQIDVPVYDALIKAARDAEIPVVGHVPIKPGLAAAFANHQASIEHFRGYDLELSSDPTSTKPEIRFSGWPRATDAQLDKLVRETLAYGIWNDPTILPISTVENTPAVRAMAVDYPYLPAHMWPAMADNYVADIFSPQVLALFRQGVPRMQAFVRKLVEAGAPVMAGTDSLAPGISLHAEIKLLKASGISNYQALATATSVPGRWLSIYTQSPERLGLVAPGYAADLVLLDSNPLSDINNIDRVAGVMTRGRWLDRGALDTRLADLRNRNQPLIAAMKAAKDKERADMAAKSAPRP